MPVVAEIFALVRLFNHARHLRNFIHALGERIKIWLAEMFGCGQLIEGRKALPTHGNDLEFQQCLLQFIPHRRILVIFKIRAVNFRADAARDGACFQYLVVHNISSIAD